MKLDSFKFRISLLSLVISGAVLVFFAIFFMSIIDHVGFERVDRELLALADAQVRRMQPPEHWPHFEQSLRSLYGESDPRQFALKVISPQGRNIYTSAHWPSGADADVLPRLPPPPSDQQAPPPRQRDAPDLRPPPGEEPDRQTPPPRLGISGPRYATVTGASRNWRVIAIGNSQLSLYVAMNLESLYAETDRLRNAFFVAIPLSLFLLALGGWLIAHRALRPVNIIAATAAGITTRGLDRRIPRTDADREFAGLIDVINGMLDRLERSFQQAVRFSGDAAHELKTPLTILQGQLEQALQDAPSGSQTQQFLSELLEEVRRLASITRKLLLLSQADSGGMRLSLSPLDLSAMLDTMCEDIPLLAPGITVRKTVPPGIMISADPDLMRQAIQNLVTNAVKYNIKDGWISIELSLADRGVRLAVSNSGEDIPQEAQSKIFERFYRVSSSRSREIDGAGLGLSLAGEIVSAHKGELLLQGSSGGVTTFILTLPQPAQDQQAGKSREARNQPSAESGTNAAPLNTSER